MKSKKGLAKIIIKSICILLVIITLIWFSIIVYEYYRVKSDKKPVICFNQTKEPENKDEYSYVCYGLLYKYKEYYYVNTDTISARELTLFFKDFTRDSD